MLTERKIRDAKPTGKAYTIWDSQVAGLGLQVTQSGKRNYVLRYKDSAGRKRQAILCRASETSLRDIRQRAGAELVNIRGGETDPLERQRDAREAPTIAEGIDRFFDETVPERLAIGKMQPKTAHEYRLQAKTIRAAIGGRRVEAVTRRDIERMVKPLPSVQRNRTLAFTSRLFSLFETWEWRPQNTNPAKGIERAREEARDRILSPAELAALAAALNDAETTSPAAVAAIRFAAVTGLRIGEILAIRWEHVSFATGRLTLPTTKTGRRLHDLPTAALGILAAVPRLNKWCFTTGRDAAVTYRTVRKIFATVAVGAGLADVRLHDLRRTVMTNAAMAGVGTHVLRDLLGHKTTAMADRYVRAVGNPVRDAREQVGAAMAAMMSGAPKAEAVPMNLRFRGQN